MNDYLDSAALFLIQSLFDLYIFIVILRIVLQWVGADFQNPLFNLVTKLTYLPLTPIRRLIPIIHGWDFAAIILLLLLEATKISILVWMQVSTFPNILGLLILAFAEILNQLLDLFFYAIIAMAILSWVNPFSQGAIVEAIFRMTDPLLRPLRRIIPPIAGLDLTPIPMMILLKLMTILVVQPLAQIGAAMVLGNS